MSTIFLLSNYNYPSYLHYTS
uniref:Uncharacterized protein n=1 Tax=Anguilla anguilla TaxID=7936 RepID=A0A0E9S8I2_ANGAN